MEKHFFRVILIGNNYIIRNLYIDSSNTTSSTGFFGEVNNGAIISNLSVTGNIICKKADAEKRTGGIAGTTSGNGIKTFINCNNYCNITSYGYTGGILGSGSKVKIIECANFGNLKTLGRRICICSRN